MNIILNRPDLVGKRFVSPRHANPVSWLVKYYHRCDAWVCEEPEHHTTCEFYTDEILNAIAQEESELREGEQLIQFDAIAERLIACQSTERK